MSLIRWEPFSEADRLLHRMLPRLAGSWPRVGTDDNGGAMFEWSPSADISETDEEFLIRAELPAVSKDNVKVTVQHGTITIEGERKQRTEEKTEKLHRVESFRGSFQRSFVLPENINADAIRCESKDGVLTVHIPKTEKAQPKQIQIEVQ